MKPLNETGRGGQFSQLTLEGFGPRDIKPTDEHRWPEGYSPERRAAVAGRISIQQENRGNSITGHPAHPYSDPRRGESGPNLGEKRVIGAIARSTVPTEHLRDSRLQTTWNHPESRLHIRTGSSDVSGAAGWFHPTTGQVDVGVSTRDISEANRADVLMHEIGHSVSNLHRTEHSMQAHWAHERETGMEHPMKEEVRHGREEAFADNYAIEHRGGRRGEALPRYSSPYEKPGTLGSAYGLDSVRSRIADREYTAARTTVPATPKVQPKGSGQFFEAPLFGRNADRFETDTQKDFGQFGWFSNADRSGGKLDSIRLGAGPPKTPEMQAGFHAPSVQMVADTEDPSIKQRYVDAVQAGNTKEAHVIANAEARGHPVRLDKARQRRNGW